MVLVSDPLGACPELNDGGHPTCCKATVAANETPKSPKDVPPLERGP